MADKKGILGAYVGFFTSPEKDRETFKKYIWGPNGIRTHWEKLEHKTYGKDLELILFQFQIDPVPEAEKYTKNIENYRPKEKAIGLSIIVWMDDFLRKTDKERYHFLMQEVMDRLDLLTTRVKKSKLDTNMIQLKTDLQAIFDSMVI